MNQSLSKDLALLLLRLSGLGLALAHGYGKVLALSGGQGDRFVEGVASLGFPLPGLFAWAAALAEFLGGLCVALGLGTRVAAAFAGFAMFVAAFVRHHAFQHLLVAVGVMRASEETVRSWGNPELALLYLLAFATLVLTGGGRFSLDRVLPGRRR
ncbi:MAG: DoxX family protein [Acidobacteria bacterium]|nr:DoxX family protein [Acidobacteriota bacterium]